jgi:para-nitrobenzyl esterase
MARKSAISLLLFASAAAATPPEAGLYYDRARPGHGLDLQVVGDRLVGTVYTFEADGQPVWYLVDGLWNGQSATITIDEYRYDPAATPPARRQASHPGAALARVTSDGECGDGSARPGIAERLDFRFAIAGESWRWCMEPIVPASELPQRALSGSWYGGEGDSGWGLISYLYGTPGSESAFHTLYLYDAEGRPRWAYATTPAAETAFTPDFVYARGYCRSCATQALATVLAGPASLRLVTPRSDVDHNRIAFDLSYPYGSGGRFTRSDQPLRALTTMPAPAGVVATREGLVAGTTVRPDLTRYLAIPYAAPPIGALRWRAPQPALPRTRPHLQASRGPSCAQRESGDGQFPSDLGVRAEDCLQLNVYTPEPRMGAGRPVMVWFHGGGLTQGSAVEVRGDGSLFYDGGLLTDDGVVVVSVNYRLGPFGYLAMRPFAGEAPDHPTAGNYGLLDQIAALQWIREHIEAFGGDPGRVTIFGESAGGLSTCALLASPLARGLFHRAIMQSGGCPRNLAGLETATTSNEAGYTQGDRILGLAGCAGVADRLACMRAIPWQQLVDLTQPTVGFGREGEDFGLLVDGYSLLEPAGVAVAAGRAAAVPLIVGINADELTTLLPAASRPQSVAEYEALVRQTVPTLWPQVLALYPASAYAEPWLAWADLLDDLQFACPARAYSAAHAAAGNPVWRYVYTHVFNNPSAQFGAFHGAELLFVFGPSAGFTAAESDLSAQIQRQWTRFAATGDPNGGNDPPWPRRTASDDVAIELDDARRGLITDYRKTTCDFWSRYVAF